MFFLTRSLNHSRRSVVQVDGHSANLGLMIRAVQENYKRFNYVDCAFCLKGIREIVSNSAKYFSSKELASLTDAEMKVLDRLKAEPADFFSVTIWAQSLQSSDVEVFVEKLQSAGVIEKINTFAISSILVSLARLDWRDEYLIDRMIIRINKSPHQLNALTISNILNSLVKLRYENTEVIDIIYKEGTSKKDFTPQGIAMSLNAMSHFIPFGIPGQQAFLDTLIERIGVVIDSFNGQTMSVVLNSLSKLQVPRESAVMKSLFEQIPKVIPRSDGHSISLLCKALTSLNVIADVQFKLISSRVQDVLQSINEQGVHFLLSYAALFNDRESCKEVHSSMLTLIADHLTVASASYSSMGVTYCLQGLVRCRLTSLDLVRVALFTRASKILQKHADKKPTKFNAKPPAFNGQEIGILLNSIQEFKYENHTLISLVISHIRTWVQSYSMTAVLTTLWGLARVRKMIPDDIDVAAVANDLYNRIEYTTLSGRAVGSLALSYSGIKVENQQLVESLVHLVKNRSDQIEMKYLSIVLTTMYSMQLADFDTILQEAIANMSLNVNAAHSNALARILHLSKTCAVHIAPKQVEAICALVEILFPKLKSFELSHVLSALITFKPTKTCVDSLDQYANTFVKQIIKDASRPTLERFIGFFAFTKGATEETIASILTEMQRHQIRSASHVEWAKRCCKTLIDTYPQLSETNEFCAMQRNIQELGEVAK